MRLIKSRDERNIEAQKEQLKTKCIKPFETIYFGCFSVPWSIYSIPSHRVHLKNCERFAHPHVCSMFSQCQKIRNTRRAMFCYFAFCSYGQPSNAAFTCQQIREYRPKSRVFAFSAWFSCMLLKYDESITTIIAYLTKLQHQSSPVYTK